MVQSVVALGRGGEHALPIHEFQRSRVIRDRMRRGDRRNPCVDLPAQRASATAVCVSVLCACLLYPAFAAYPNIYLSASPNISTMLFCVIFYAACLKRTRWFLLPVIMLLWVNLHGGFLLGFLIIGAFGGAAILKRDWAGFKFFCVSALDAPSSSRSILLAGMSMLPLRPYWATFRRPMSRSGCPIIST